MVDTIRARLIAFTVGLALLVALPGTYLGHRWANTDAGENTSGAACRVETPDLGVVESERAGDFGLFALVIAAVATLLAWIFATRLSAPLIALREATRELAAGKLDRRVTMQGSEEIRSLGGAFNEMAARLEQLVSARYRAEAELRHARNDALQASRLKSSFLATMSHEIRTPMNGIMAMVDLLRGSSLDLEQREFADTIHTSAEHLLAIINDILDFSKIEAGKLVLDAEDFELRPAIESMIDLIAPAAQKRGLEIVCSIAPDTPRVVNGDLGRLRQILANLTGNAVKFTEKGEVAVRVEVESRRADTVRLACSVSDTGIGISPAAKKILFQPFVQADNSMSRRYGGTGLGIAISKQLVEAMHGRIRCDSTPGVGSIFSFTVELGCSERRTVKPTTGGTRAQRAAVVEPNAVARKSLLEQLSALGLEPHGFDAVEGLSALETNDDRPVLLLIEGGALGPDPAAGLAALRSRRAFSTAPIVVMAPVVVRPSLEPLLGDAGVELLKKPIRVAALEVCVSRALSEKTIDLGRSDPCATTLEPTAPALPVFSSASLDLGRGARRVLVAEDNAVNQRVAMHLLKRLGLEPTLVPDGRAAVTEVSKAHYDFVLMDVQMPEMDGYEATAAIRKLEPEIGHVRIFAMTANALEGDREFCLASGMDDYVSKPVTMQALSELLARWPETAPPKISS